MILDTRLLCTSCALALVLASAPVFAQTQPGGGQTIPPTVADPTQASEAQEPAAANDANLDPVGVTTDEDEEIVVTGLRASLRSAQSIKRNSDQIVDAIVAEDIGKLPDNNASEALARVTGVQVNRNADEANGVIVRGLPDLITTFNGREIFTADARGVALQDFPAAALAGLEVYKSTTANLIEGGIAGLINVRARRPFDFKDGLEIAGAVRGTYNDQSRKYDPNGSILVSNRWDTGIGEIGALINLSYTRTTFLNGARFNGGGITTATPEQGAATNFRYPDFIGIFYGRGQRTRPSVNGSLQWAPTSNLEIYVDGLYQGFRGRDANDFIGIPIGGNNSKLSNVVLDADDPNKAQSLTVTGGPGPELFKGVPTGDTDTYQAAIGGTYTADYLKFSTDFAYTDSTFRQTDYGFDTAINRSAVTDVNFDVEGEGGVEFGFRDLDLSDPNNYIVRGIFDRRLKATGKSFQWRGDVEFETAVSLFPQIDFGVRYVDRDGAYENGTRYAFLRPLGIPISQAPFGEGVGIIRGGFRGSDVQPTRTWYAPTRAGLVDNIDALRDFARAGLDRRIQENPNDQGLRNDRAAYQAALPDINPQQSFDANEKSYTAYGQLRYEFALGSVDIDGVVGLRAVETVNRLVGTGRINGVLTPIARQQKYLDLLPNASARIRFTPQLQLRLSSTETRTRPGFGQLSPSFNIDRQNIVDPTSPFQGSSGNIDLDPIESTNYDASLEYYFSNTGSASVAVFRRDIDGFIADYSRQVTDPEFGLINIRRPENAGVGRIEGVEAQITGFFDFLPGFLSGFGAQINGTYLDGSQRIPAVFAGTSLDNGRNLAIQNVSKYTYNVIGFYERGPINMRLAYNYRSKFVNFYDNNREGESLAGESTRGIERLDFSASYTPFEALTVTFDVSNITGKPFNNVRDFTDTQSFTRDIRYEARVYSLGARFRL